MHMLLAPVGPNGGRDDRNSHGGVASSATKGSGALAAVVSGNSWRAESTLETSRGTSAGSSRHQRPVSWSQDACCITCKSKSCHQATAGVHAFLSRCQRVA